MTGTQQQKDWEILARQSCDALAPFAEIGAWLVARQNIPDKTPLVDIKDLLNAAKAGLTRRDFRAAYMALCAIDPDFLERRFSECFKGQTAWHP